MILLTLKKTDYGKKLRRQKCTHRTQKPQGTRKLHGLRQRIITIKNDTTIIKEPRTGREGKVVAMTSEIVEVDYGGGIRRKYLRKYARFL